jgi:anti-sigma factor RsiW
MSCTKFESLIALYVESDLAESERRIVEAHLESCHGCQEFAADIRESQTALKELRMDFVEESSLQEVRAGVLNQLRTQRKKAAWPWYAVAAMLLAGLLAGWLWRARTAAPPEVQPRAAVITPPTLAAVPARPQRVRIARVSKHHRHPAPAFQSEPLVVKIVTDDPQVVIYWLVSKNGG